MPDYGKIFEAMGEAALYIEGGTVSAANRAALSLLGKEEDELVGFEFVQAFCEHAENDVFNRIILDAIYDENVSHEKIVPFFDGRKQRSLHVKVSFVKEEGQTLGVVVALDDISDILKLRDDLISIEEAQTLNDRLEARDQMLGLSRAQYKGEAETDVLTGLYNRAAAECIAIANIEQMLPDEFNAVFFVDIDNFGEVNRDYGEVCGDLALKQFARILKRLFRSSDCVGRFGNDEFMVIMTGFTDGAIVERKAQQIVDSAKRVAVEGTNLRVTVSVGVAIAPTDGKTYDEVAEKALAALKEARAMGSDNFLMAGR